MKISEQKIKKGKELEVIQNENSWYIVTNNTPQININYTIATHRQFVANSYVDDEHAYIIPTNTYLFNEKHINTPVSVKIVKPKKWSQIATGLKLEEENVYSASNFDIFV